jgi:hypothetical protein
MRALVLVGVAGCFNPRLAAHLQCEAPDNWCPSPMTCGADGTCGGGAGGDDGGPSGPPEGNLVFTSSEFIILSSYPTTAEIFAAADAKCNMLGQKLRAGGAYMAWLGTTMTEAADRLPAKPGWGRFDGAPVVTSVADLKAAKLLYPNRFDDDHADVPMLRVETDIASVFSPNCSPNNDVSVGKADGDGKQWWNWSSLPCSDPLYLYCFETDRDAAVPAPQLDSSLLYAFVTANQYPASGGPTMLDRHCQDEADAANLSRTFRALVATTTGSARSRFTPSTKAWTRLDGVIIAQPALNQLTAPLTVTPAGAHLDAFAFTGAQDPTRMATTTSSCSDWTASASAQTPSTGYTARSDSASFFDGFGATCAAAYLYCLEVP